MWWKLHIGAALVVCTIQATGRYYGLSTLGYTIYAIGCLLFLSWMVPKAFELSPSFFQGCFLSLIAIASGNFITSFLIFKETISTYNLIGAVGAVICSLLLIL